MCGIAGIVDVIASAEEMYGDVERMLGVQRHRGPDGERVKQWPWCAFGHLRLAIIDLSDAAGQPMSDTTGRYHLVFNGEIYNYIELRRELMPRYQFVTESDAEVLLASFATWGERCLDKLRGMFAFAVWDSTERRLFAARDRFGIKPFHYWTNGARLVFASELKALLDFIPERRALAHLASQYIAWNLLDHVPDQTMVESIKRLPAAHAMRWSRGEGLSIWRYWDVAISNQLSSTPAARRKYVQEFRERLDEAVALHLRSDVAVGTCLSGGLDSSALAGLVNAELQRAGGHEKQHTFSACFDDSAIDERPYMNAVTRRLGCHAHEVFPDGDRLTSEIDDWMWQQDEPVPSTGVYSQFCVARLARESGVKVLLDGQGADELLAGYRKFILVYLRQLVRHGRTFRAMREAWSFGTSWEILRTSRLAQGKRYLFGRVRDVDRLFGSKGVPARPASLGLNQGLGDRLGADLFHFSLPSLLRFEDRNTMAFGIESRVPYLDHVLVEWAAKLPADVRISGGWTKRILREGAADVLPTEVRLRKSKLGFSTPESAWVNGPLKEWILEMIEGARHLYEIVDRNAVGELTRRLNTGDTVETAENLLFRMAAYENWGRLFLE